MPSLYDYHFVALIWLTDCHNVKSNATPNNSQRPAMKALLLNNLR